MERERGESESEVEGERWGGEGTVAKVNISFGHSWYMISHLYR